MIEYDGGKSLSVVVVMVVLVVEKLVMVMGLWVFFGEKEGGDGGDGVFGVGREEEVLGGGCGGSWRWSPAKVGDALCCVLKK